MFNDPLAHRDTSRDRAVGPQKYILELIRGGELKLSIRTEIVGLPSVACLSKSGVYFEICRKPSQRQSEGLLKFNMAASNEPFYIRY
jgi:hypothetical protein